MNEASARLDASNRKALERRDAYRQERAAGAGGGADFQKLKHEFPYVGFVDCRAEDIAFLMFHANDDVVAWEYFWLGDDAYERPIVSQWIAWAREATTVLDIGSYTGLMSILAGLANPDCTIHAMEPIERTVERMKINLRANGLARRVTIHPRAAAAEFGPEMINYYRDEDFLGTGNSIHDKGKTVHARRMIQMVNTDQYLGSKHTFDLIKVDVEGFEPQVLDGLQRIIRRDRPKIVLEVWQENEAEVFARLDKLGYRYRPVEPKPARVMNYLCEPK
ncbi:FkbM family methyltransferase [Aurantimonas sp. VKM B-3413]|uniref:FkbM family methyltransferase n=1 Tax=Aurantimonas sp. VKM B-3413 TaxID=2779401 RepID=UPI001E491859|nr:FkbM family methyltransferase [Aurantimonas sp. VKM B-3413]MCB8836482.1 FkbM family methyltransferase [Aurantimonas sp. VKM B-3413]